MGIVSWIVAGLIAGIVASLVIREGKLVGNIVLGAVGGALAGWIATFFGLGAIATFGWASALVALGGGLVVAFAFAALMRSRA